jgi:hypothetical protein
VVLRTVLVKIQIFWQVFPDILKSLSTFTLRAQQSVKNSTTGKAVLLDDEGSSWQESEESINICSGLVLLTGRLGVKFKVLIRGPLKGALLDFYMKALQSLEKVRCFHLVQHHMLKMYLQQ